MQYRRAMMEDLNGILLIIHAGQAYLKSQGVCQWTGGYPSKELLAADLAGGIGRVLCEGGALLCYAAVLTTPEPTYAAIYGGAWHTPEPYVTIHRLGVAKEARRMGAGSRMLQEIGAEFLGLPLRADTHEGNKPMRGMLEKAGMTHCGVIYLADGQKRVAYERSAFALS